jgi:hypothetical protein
MRPLIVLSTAALFLIGATVTAANAAQFEVYADGPGSLMALAVPRVV